MLLKQDCREIGLYSVLKSVCGGLSMDLHSTMFINNLVAVQCSAECLSPF